MIKDNQRYLNRLHVVVDAVVTAASYLLAWWLMFGSRFADKEIGVLDMGIYFSALYFVVPGYLILYYWNKLYTPKRVQRPENEILNIIRANLIGIILFLAGLYLANPSTASCSIFPAACWHYLLSSIRFREFWCVR